jgi:hypothetical protein
VEVARLEHRADAADRVVELAVAAPEDQGVAGGGSASPSSSRRVVVLPAPLGPRKPVTVPGASENVTLSTATSSP